MTRPWCFGAEVGAHRNTEDPARRNDTLGHGRGARWIGVRRLMMKRVRIVHRGGNAAFVEGRLNRRPLLDRHRVLRPGAGAARSNRRHLQPGQAGQRLRVPRRQRTPPCHFPVEPLELREHHGALQRVHAAPDADSRVHVAAALAMRTDLAAGLGQRVVVGEDGTAVAIAAERLAREKAGAAERAQVAALAGSEAGAEALRRILDDGQAVPLGDGIDRVHVRALAVKAHRKNGSRARRDRRFDLRRVDVEGVLLDVDEDRLAAEQGDHFGRSGKREGRGDHFIAGPKLERHQADQQRLGAAGHGDAVPRADASGKTLLELADFGPQDVLPVIEHTLDSCVDARLERLILALQVDEGYRLHHSASGSANSHRPSRRT